MAFKSNLLSENNQDTRISEVFSDSVDNMIEDIDNEFVEENEKIETTKPFEEKVSKYNEYNIVVDKIIYADQYSGFAIASVSAKNPRQPIYSNYNNVTAKQTKAIIKIQNDREVVDLLKEKANLIVIGQWIYDEHYGLQLSVIDISPVFIEDEKDMKKFIQNGGLKNINEELAGEIIFYGIKNEQLIKNIISDPMELKKIDLINELEEKEESKFLAKEIAKEWFHYQQSYLFVQKLSKYGLKKGKGLKIYNFIVSNEAKKIPAISRLNKLKYAFFFKSLDNNFYLDIYNHFLINPYFYTVISGIGFKTIDEFALNIGMKETDDRRIEAIITHTINEECKKTKNTILEFDKVYKTILNIKGLTRENVDNIFKKYLADKKVLIRKINFDNKGEKKYITTDQIFIAEYITAKKINELNSLKVDVNQEAINEIESEDFNNDESQTNAIKNCYLSPVSIITGGPGTGKTTTLKKLIHIFNKYEKDKKIVLLSPTGKAAKKIDESVNSDLELKKIKLDKAETIHKFIFRDYKSGNSKIYDKHIFIIDESSMIDTMLMYHLIKRIGYGSRLILVGDIDQIPPVEMGQVMKDLIESKKISLSRLTHIHRVNEKSQLPDVAQLINKGIFPEKIGNYKTDDYSYIECQSIEDMYKNIKDVIIYLLSNNLMNKKDIQIICPQYGTEIGVNELNNYFKWFLNEELDFSEEEAEYNKLNNRKEKNKKMPFIDGDRIINKVNNYELEIFNGEMGIVKNKTNESFTFKFTDDDREVFINDKKIINNFDLSYAITVHKSQGSEMPCIIMPLVKSHSFTLNKFLLYTAVTRSKSKVILVGNKDAYLLALRKKNEGNRLTTLLYEMEVCDKHESVYQEIINSKNYFETEIEID